MIRNRLIYCKKIVSPAALFTLALLMTIAGCQKSATTVTHQAPATFEPQVQNRQWPESQANYKNVAVQHDTLYLAGPYEKSGGDNVFDELTREDLLATFACPALFLGNVATMPADMILTPPIKTQHSRSVFPLEAPAYEPFILQSEQYKK